MARGGRDRRQAQAKNHYTPVRGFLSSPSYARKPVSRITPPHSPNTPGHLKTTNTDGSRSSDPPTPPAARTTVQVCARVHGALEDPRPGRGGLVRECQGHSGYIGVPMVEEREVEEGGKREGCAWGEPNKGPRSCGLAAEGATPGAPWRTAAHVGLKQLRRTQSPTVLEKR